MGVFLLSQNFSKSSKLRTRRNKFPYILKRGISHIHAGITLRKKRSKNSPKTKVELKKVIKVESC